MLITSTAILRINAVQNYSKALNPSIALAETFRLIVRFLEIILGDLNMFIKFNRKCG